MVIWKGKKTRASLAFCTVIPLLPVWCWKSLLKRNKWQKSPSVAKKNRNICSQLLSHTNTQKRSLQRNGHCKIYETYVQLKKNLKPYIPTYVNSSSESTFVRVLMTNQIFYPMNVVESQGNCRNQSFQWNINGKSKIFL